MKVLIIVPTLTSYLFLREMCLKLASDGDEVHLATSWSHLGQYEVDVERINFHAIEFPRGMNPVAHLQAAKQLKKIVTSISPDIIDVHFSAAAFTAALARTTAWPPVIATIQGLRFPLAKGLNALILRWAECWSASRLDKLVVLTADDFEALKRSGVENCYQQAGYGFGCDLEKFNKLRFSAQELREAESKISKAPGEIVFTYIGRLVEFKGFHLVVKAYLEAHNHESGIKLLVCGEFDKYHPSGLEPSELADFNSKVNIVNIGWTDVVDQYLSVSDAVIFPSEREGVPVNLMEALAMGVPVITCDSRGCREVMNQGKNGIVLKERNAESLAEAMLSLATDAALRKSYSMAALDFRSNFDRLHFVDGHIELLKASCLNR